MIATSRAHIPADVLFRVLSSNGGRCSYCWKVATGVDHIVPWSVTQDDSETNLAPSCRRCNQTLGARRFASLDAKKAFLNSVVSQSFAQELGILLRVLGLDAEDAADRCKIERLRLADLAAGVIDPEPIDLLRLRKGLHLHWDIDEFSTAEAHQSAARVRGAILAPTSVPSAEPRGQVPAAVTPWRLP